MTTIINLSSAPALMKWGTNECVVPTGSWQYSGPVTDVGTGTAISAGTVIYSGATVYFEPRKTAGELYLIGLGLGVSLMFSVWMVSVVRKIVTNSPSFAD